MTHDYKYENMNEEDRNALIPWDAKPTFFADLEQPVFDGPPIKVEGPLPDLNTENAGE